MQIRVGVIGAGSWGTTVAHLAACHAPTTLWARDAAVADEIETRSTNERYLPGLPLSPALRATTSMAEAVAHADLVVVGVPSHGVRDTMGACAPDVPPGASIVSLTKGFEQGSRKRMTEVLAELLPGRAVGVLTGPNLAKEIAERQPTATVVACTDPGAARFVAEACASSYFRPYTNDDVVGVELCGAVKNVIALAVGMAQGRGFGSNTTATVITRGLVEITRLGLALGASAETFSGLAGMGDLVATCTSPLSRNNTLGRHIGEGMSLDEALEATGTTAEGAKSCRSVLDLAGKHGVDMPITAGVVSVLYDGLPVEEMARELLSRPQKAEGVGA